VLNDDALNRDTIIGADTNVISTGRQFGGIERQLLPLHVLSSFIDNRLAGDVHNGDINQGCAGFEVQVKNDLLIGWVREYANGACGQRQFFGRYQRADIHTDERGYGKYEAVGTCIARVESTAVAWAAQGIR